MCFFKFLHGSNQSIYIFHRTSIVGRSTETTHQTVTFHAYDVFRFTEIQKFFLQFFISFG